MEKLENKLIDMREMYQEYKDRALSPAVSLSLKYFQIHKIPFLIFAIK